MTSNMALFEPLSIIFFTFLFLPHIATSLEACMTSYCSGSVVPIQFPFRLRNSQSSTRCGYPGFNLSCTITDNGRQPILRLPISGSFLVEGIDYQSQSIFITDPQGCMPQRFLDGFSVSGSPYLTEFSNFTFLNCSDTAEPAQYHFPCLSGVDYTVKAIPTSAYMTVPSSCSVMKTVMIPYLQLYGFGPLSGSVQLNWNEPSCGSCEEEGGSCGFNSDTGLDVGCSLPQKHGIPRSAKYGLVIGAGIPGLLCLIVLFCYVCNRMRDYGRQHLHPDTEFSTLINTQQRVVKVGLDGSIIEKFPMILLGESRRLPKPSDNICPICLSEYRSKETLRTIPECNHYFHANCIDEWLKINATCPLCRNSPEESSIAKPSSLPSIVSPSPLSSSSSSSLL
ncbi:zf-RING_2 domain-containing protein [Cephalotus follicularis]|uniref:RING-type E3 ubiquitin transferase n=1 Tax=Cephalotus follicularis TaxID=3775 RepID=A0A1Q3BCQ1_CEPFO|nr:zf-RING_2 domain-containing protein [Cephalotus follicularis]